MEETISKLNEFVEQYKNLHKLPKGVYSEVIKCLSKILVAPDSWDRGFTYVFELPPELSSQAFIEGWKCLGEDEKELMISRWLSFPDFPKNTGILRQIHMVNQFISVSPETAVTLLKDVSLKMTENATKLPSDSRAETFKNILLVSGITSISLQDQKFKIKETIAVFLVAVSALLQQTVANFSPERERYVLAVLEWIPSLDLPATLSRQVAEVLVKGTMDWSDRCKRILLSYGVPHDLMLGHQLEETVVADSNVEAINSKVNDNEDVTTSQSDSHAKPKFNIKATLSDLKQYIEELEADAFSTRRIQNELDYAQRLRLQQESKIRELELVIAEKNNQQSQLQKELEDVKRQVISLKETMEGKEQEFDYEVERLIGTSEREQVAFEEGYKNKLAKKLKPEYKDFVEIETDTMTVDLGESLRAQLQTVFRILQREGIKF